MTPTLISRFLARQPRSASRPAPAAPDQRRRRRRLWLQIAFVVVMSLGILFWTTSARILGEPVELAYGPADALFSSSMGPLVGSDFIPGNSARTLVNGDEFFPAMLRAIREARRTITLETYIWASGRISDEFIAVLSERAREGIKIQILVDGMGALKFRRDDRDRLRASGVELHVYGREHWYDVRPNINHRTHRKILVVDGRIGFTGGMCIDDKWLGNAESPEVWRETQIRIEGPAVRQMQAVFATNWLQTTGRLITGPDYFPEAERAGSVLANSFKSGPREDPENARISYLLAIAGARASIKISHAYFVPDDLAVEMLLAARKRGVRIEVMVPGMNDSRFGRAAARSRWGKLLAAGVEFHLYQRAMLHCKVMIVDDMFVTIGSVNFDNRSFGINDEISVNVIDAAFARENTRIFEADLKQSVPLTREEFERRPLWVRAADHFCGIFRSQL